MGGFDYIAPQPDRSVDAEANVGWDRTGAQAGRVYLIWTQERKNERIGKMNAAGTAFNFLAGFAEHFQGVEDAEQWAWGLAKRIYDELAKAINTPAVKEKLQGQGIDVSGAPGSELDAFVRKEIARWAKVIKDNNIKSGD